MVSGKQEHAIDLKQADSMNQTNKYPHAGQQEYEHERPTDQRNDASGFPIHPCQQQQ